MTKRIGLAWGLLGALVVGSTGAEEPAPPPGTLYVVATAHLDTQWRWTLRDTVERYLPATLRGNFDLFERFPGYTFSFEGAFRYLLAKEYYPEDFERLRGYVRHGRWRVAGSWVDAVDVNVPSPESLFRHALYGNGFFRRELGVTSRDVFLPDCFGFGFALPSVAAHSGLDAFSTQKLTWGSAVGVPFDVGLWEGVDGSTLVAALAPGDYVSKLEGDLSSDPNVLEAVERTRSASGLPVGLKYFGVGDQGGAPGPESVEWLQRSMAGEGPVRVLSAAPDELARDLEGNPLRDRLPRYRGELLMTSHGAGCYTSQAAMKRWNRKNEVLADAAERAAVAADWLGAIPYPAQTLHEAWIRVLWHQFHDDLTGTSIPEGYTLSWADEAVAGNQLAGVLDDAVAAVSRGLDTSSDGVALVVYNPLSVEREDVVEATVAFPGTAAPRALEAFGPDGARVPVQVTRLDGDRIGVLLLARVPAVGFAVFELRPAAPGTASTGALTVAGRVLQSPRYRVELNADGDVASVFDRALDRELLAGPLELQLLENSPSKWPAWEIDLDDLSAPPRAVAGAPARFEVAETGPVRVALRVTREALGSTFVQTVRLAAGGAGDRVELDTVVDWRTPGALLKASFTLAPASERATFDLGLGTVERGVNTEKLYEVPAQRWADLSDPEQGVGVAVLNDSRYGWDHPDPSTLRLTLVHTPAVPEGWRWVGDQATQDLGRHRVLMALTGHSGDWRQAGVTWQADRLNQPLLAWQTPAHDGPLGRSLSLARVAAPGDPVAIRALKRAEESEEIVVRLQELHGRPVEDARLSFARPILAARELSADEQPLLATDPRAGNPAELAGGTLRVPFAPYQPRTFAVRVAGPPSRLGPPSAAPIPLPFDLDGASFDGTPDGDADGAGNTFAAELLPERLEIAGVPFRLGPTSPGAANLLACRGQRLQLPAGDWDRLDLLLTSVDGDREATFSVGDRKLPEWVQDWSEPVGQWDSRLDAGRLVDDPARVVPAYLKPGRVGWVGTHRHGPDGANQVHVLTQVFLHRLPVGPGAGAVTLPDDPALRLLAATAVRGGGGEAVPVQPLTEQPDRPAVLIRAPRAVFVGSTSVELSSPVPHAVVRYTLDGSEPGPDSPVATGPVTLTETTTLSARAFGGASPDGYLARATFTRLEPRPAVAVDNLKHGLECRYFEGEWRKLPDFGGLRPIQVGVVPEVGTPPFARAEHFALELEGYVRVPADGLYELSLRSDDGSALELGGERVVDSDGVHGAGDDRAEVALAAGLHPIRVTYFQARGDRALELWVEGPGFAMRPVRPEELVH